MQEMPPGSQPGQVEYQRHALAQDGGKGGPGDPHVQHQHQQQVQGQIGQVAGQGSPAGQFLVVVVAQVVVQQVGGKEHRHTPQDQLYIAAGGSIERRSGRAGPQKRYELGQQQRTGQRQHNAAAHRDSKDLGKVFGGGPGMPGPQCSGKPDGTAGSHAVHQQVDDHEDWQCQAHGGQPGGPHTLAQHHGIGHVSQGQSQGREQRRGQGLAVIPRQRRIARLFSLHPVLGTLHDFSHAGKHQTGAVGIGFEGLHGGHPGQHQHGGHAAFHT